jgi:hypothetical protein
LITGFSTREAATLLAALTHYRDEIAVGNDIDSEITEIATHFGRIDNPLSLDEIDGLCKYITGGYTERGIGVSLYFVGHTPADALACADVDLLHSEESAEGAMIEHEHTGDTEMKIWRFTVGVTVNDLDPDTDNPERFGVPAAEIGEIEVGQTLDFDSLYDERSLRQALYERSAEYDESHDDQSERGRFIITDPGFGLCTVCGTRCIGDGSGAVLCPKGCGRGL